MWSRFGRDHFWVGSILNDSSTTLLTLLANKFNYPLHFLTPPLPFIQPFLSTRKSFQLTAENIPFYWNSNLVSAILNIPIIKSTSLVLLLYCFSQLYIAPRLIIISNHVAVSITARMSVVWLESTTIDCYHYHTTQIMINSAMYCATANSDDGKIFADVMYTAL